jgi:hypothetical protein
MERAVRETARGRAFLDEYARRVRADDTDRILCAIEKLKGSLDRTKPETTTPSVTQTRKDIAPVKPAGSGSRTAAERVQALAGPDDNVLFSL